MRLSMWHRGFKTGISASLASTVALGVLGKLEGNSAYQPVNAISHWIWGDKAAQQTGFSFQYTVTGYVIHHASSTFWALIYEEMNSSAPDITAPAIAWSAVKMAALAAYADYQLTPHRLQPGYEQCLSKPSLALVYLAFAAGLAQHKILQRHASSG